MKKALNLMITDIRAALKQVWSAAGQSSFCCGIPLDCCEAADMPTPSSCCGVRV